MITITARPKSIIYKHSMTLFSNDFTIKTNKYAILKEGPKVVNVVLVEDDFDDIVRKAYTKNLDKTLIGIPKISSAYNETENIITCFFWTKNDNIDRATIEFMTKLIKNVVTKQKTHREKQVVVSREMLKKLKDNPRWKS